jgi:hypothetical protein
MPRSHLHLCVNDRKGRSGRKVATEADPFDRDPAIQLCVRLLLVKSRDCLQNRRVPGSETKRQRRSLKVKLHENCIREVSSGPISGMTAVKLQPPLTVTIRAQTNRSKPFVPTSQRERFTRSGAEVLAEV